MFSEAPLSDGWNDSQSSNPMEIALTWDSPFADPLDGGNPLPPPPGGGP